MRKLVLLLTSLLLTILGCWAFHTAWAADSESGADADAVISAPAAGETAPTESGPMIAKARDGATVVVQPLDAALNPYRGQYAQWDRWIYNHYQADFDPAKYGGG